MFETASNKILMGDDLNGSKITAIAIFTTYNNNNKK